MSEFKLRSLADFTKVFKVPKDDKVLLKRIETNGLYYAANYALVIGPALLLRGFLWAVVAALLCLLHAITRPRNLKSKFNLFAGKMRASQKRQAVDDDAE